MSSRLLVTHFLLKVPHFQHSKHDPGEDNPYSDLKDSSQTCCPCITRSTSHLRGWEGTGRGPAPNITLFVPAGVPRGLCAHQVCQLTSA